MCDLAIVRDFFHLREQFFEINKKKLLVGENDLIHLISNGA